jgi:uncharacterized protein with GYD domain
MPKYLFKASYTSEGVAGVAKKGGSARRDALQHLFEANGGKLEAFYFAFGETDAYVFGDLPDAETAAAIALAVNRAGAASVSTVVLLTPEEIDGAAKRAIDYIPPGG